jgi:hypothetical protein
MAAPESTPMALSLWVFTKGNKQWVCGERRVLLRGLIIQPVKPMVSSSLLDEGLCAAASHIMDSNGCSGASLSPLSIRYFDRFMSFRKDQHTIRKFVKSTMEKQ